MKKWIKRMTLFFIGLIIVLFLALRFLMPGLYFTMKLGIGSDIQRYGYADLGNRMIKNSLDKVPPKASVHRIFSIQLTKIGNFDESYQLLSRASELGPKEVDGYFGWIMLYYYRDYEKALELLSKYDNYTPELVDYVGDDNILYAKGLCHKQLNNLEQALSHFDQTIEYELKRRKGDIQWIPLQYFFQRGRTHHLLSNYEAAIEDYNTALKIWEDCSESLYYKAQALYELGDSTTACQTLDTSLKAIKKGLKSQDTYVELFDEIYEQQITQAINNKCR